MMRPHHWIIGVVIIVLVSTISCRNATQSKPTNNLGRVQSTFAAYLNSEVPAADGFDFAVGDANGKGSYQDLATGTSYNGWYVATQFNEEYSLGIHTGEDWNGSGGGNTDLGQDVHAVADGLVTFAENCGRLWGNVLIIEHRYYENHEPRKILSLYAHLNKIKVNKNDKVNRRQVIATIGQDPDKTFQAHLHLELRWDASLPATYWPSSNGKSHDWISEHYTAPSQFISTHRTLPVPEKEKTLVLVDQQNYKARIYEAGVIRAEFDVSFGQGRGQKEIEGDNKTPKGMYFVVQKHRGEFDGPYAAFYGGHWIKINYPNKYDAERGLAQSIISKTQRDQISASWLKREPTLQNTRLGGGIGFHGWNTEWQNDGPRHLSWGCVVMHLRDIDAFYDKVPEGTMVVIF